MTTLLSPLAGGLLLMVVLLICLWLASLPLKDASLVDRFWGLAFVIQACWYAAGGFGSLVYLFTCVHI